MKLLIGLLLLSNVAMAQINNIGDITLNKPQITVPFAFLQACAMACPKLYMLITVPSKTFPRSE